MMESLAEKLAARRSALKKKADEVKTDAPAAPAAGAGAGAATAGAGAGAGARGGRVSAADEERAGAEAMERIHERVRAADLPSWYEALKDYTYPSIFMPIPIEEGRAMVAHYEHHSNPKTKTTPFTNTSAIAALALLETRLNTAMADFKDGAFVKLSSRSPKDAVVASGKTKEIFRALLNESKERDDNAGLIAINRAHIQALRMTSARDIVTTFLASERIYEDLTLALDYPAKWNQEFVFRKWVGVPIEYEIRGFVFGGVLTSMCQYYHYCYFPALVEQKARIEELVRKFFTEVKDKIPLRPHEYVVDFAVDLASNRVYIIELNPFGDYDGMGTSTSMFDKNLPRDRAILFGTSPFEYRIETAKHAHLFKHMADEWRKLWIEEGLHPGPGAASAATATATATTTTTGTAPTSTTTPTPAATVEVPPA